MCLKGIVVQFLHQPATMDDPDPRRQPIDLTEDVAGHEDRDAFVGREAAEQLADLDDAGGIQPIGWLIEDEQLRRRQQRTRKGQPLQIAERQACRLADPRMAGVPAARGLDPPRTRRASRPSAGRCRGSLERSVPGRRSPTRRGDRHAATGPWLHWRTRSPNSSACPAVGRIIPSSIRIVVDLPAPLRPRNA